jgi:2-keto-4-pentenoate hydratase/2-oxohepta-3-ene-1,7-dioic acid hydratase in catechol pathway
VNGERMQTGNTRTMIFTVAEIIAHLSELFTLHPGRRDLDRHTPGCRAWG